MELQELLNQYIKKFEGDASNTHYDNVVRRVFGENEHNREIEAVLLKVSVLNSHAREPFKHARKLSSPKIEDTDSELGTTELFLMLMAIT